MPITPRTFSIEFSTIKNALRLANAWDPYSIAALYRLLHKHSQFSSDFLLIEIKGNEEDSDELQFLHEFYAKNRNLIPHHMFLGFKVGKKHLMDGDVISGLGYTDWEHMKNAKSIALVATQVATKKPTNWTAAWQTLTQPLMLNVDQASLNAGTDKEKQNNLLSNFEISRYKALIDYYYSQSALFNRVWVDTFVSFIFPREKKFKTKNKEFIEFFNRGLALEEKEKISYRWYLFRLPDELSVLNCIRYFFSACWLTVPLRNLFKLFIEFPLNLISESLKIQSKQLIISHSIGSSLLSIAAGFFKILYHLVGFLVSPLETFCKLHAYNEWVAYACAFVVTALLATAMIYAAPISPIILHCLGPKIAAALTSFSTPALIVLPNLSTIGASMFSFAVLGLSGTLYQEVLCDNLNSVTNHQHSPRFFKAVRSSNIKVLHEEEEKTDIPKEGEVCETLPLS